MQNSLTEQLADWLIEKRSTGFDNKSLETARYYVTDWLSSALAGTSTAPGRSLLDYGKQQPAGTCKILGSDMTLSPELAALINGGLSHIVEMDDLDRRSVVHPATVVIPAALALTQREEGSGRDFLSAVVAGYEVAIRIGEAVGKAHYYYFHNTATCGVFGAAAAAGWLLGLTKDELVWALGNAGTQSAGLWQFNADGDMSKHLHAGMAGSNGIRAAEMAKAGLTGARAILEGERGFFAATAPDADPELVVRDLGSGPLKIDTVSIKPHASCRHTHSAIDAALALRPQIQERSIERCQVDTYQAALDLCDNATPATPYAAKFSLQYCVTSALLLGSAGLADFEPDVIASQPIRGFLPKVAPVLSNSLEAGYPINWPARITIELNDGTIMMNEVQHPKGDPENALTIQELEAKFIELVRHANCDPEPWLDWIYGLMNAERITF